MSRMRADDDVAEEVRTELESHLASRIDENLSRGLNRRDAEREARRRLGSVSTFSRQSVRVRRRAGSLRRALVFDLRHACRGLGRHPLITACGGVVVAIGLTTAFATARLVDAILMTSPPGIRGGADLYSALDSFDGRRGVLVAYPTFRAMTKAVPDESIFAWSDRDLQIVSERTSHAVNGTLASGAYFQALGTKPDAGRLLDRRDDDRQQPVAVVSRRLAMEIAGTALGLIGRSVRVNGRSLEIVGVTERGFHGVEVGKPADLWVPLSLEPAISTVSVFPDGRRIQGFLNAPKVGWLRVGLRRPSAITIGEIESRLNGVLRGPLVEQADTARDPGTSTRRVRITARIWHSPFSGNRQPVISVITTVTWAAGVVLFLSIACLASLWIGRLSERSSELPVQLALGASRARLLRTTAFEMSGIVGVGAIAAVGGTEALFAAAGRLQLAPGILIRDVTTAPLDARAVALLAALAIAVGLSAGIPALLFGSRMMARARVSSARGSQVGTRFRRVLLALQVASGCALLSGAVLLSQSIDSLRARPLGYDASAVAFAELDPQGAGLTLTEQRALFDRLRHLPVPSAITYAYADVVPYSGDPTLFLIAEQAVEKRQFPIATSRVSPEYFDVVGVRLLAGRTFIDGDQRRPVAILSDRLASVYWPGQNPVGQTIRVGGKTGVPHEVIGVVTAVRDAGLKGEPGSRLYLPFDETAETLTVVVRSATLTREQSLTALLAGVRTLDQRLVVMRTGSLLDLAWQSIEQRVLLRFIAMVVGVGSLIMVAAGIWGLACSTVRARWREYGIRQALGASQTHIGYLAMNDAWIVSLCGAMLGALGAWQLGRLFDRWLYGVSAGDPLALLSGVTLVVAATIGGAVWPARQAARMDPATLLRQD